MSDKPVAHDEQHAGGGNRLLQQAFLQGTLPASLPPPCWLTALARQEPKEKHYNSAAALPKPLPTAAPNYGGARDRSASVEFLTVELQDEATKRFLLSHLN